MEDSASSIAKKASNWGELALSAVSVLLVLLVIFVLFVNREAIVQFFREAHYQPLGIATTPAGASVIFDGEEIGTSPITIKTAPGPHTIVVRKQNFKEQSLAINLERDRYERGEGRAVRLVYAADPWIVNLALDPLPSEAKVPVVEDQVASKDSTQAVPDVADPDENPSAASSLGADPLLDGRIDLIEQRIQLLDGKVEFASMLKLAVIAMLVAIFLALGVQVLGHLRR